VQDYLQDETILAKWVDPHKLKNVNGVWWKEGRMVITQEAPRRRQIIRNHHDLPAYGHPGISRTTELVARRFWWPRMGADVLNYVMGCADCQRNKVNTQSRKATLSPIFPKPEALPFETVAMDFIVKLPLSNGFNSILTITDHDCTKAVIFIPCNETITAEGVVELYLQHVFKRFGFPQKIISDRDPRLAGKFACALCRVLGIEQNMSTAFHPRTDGQSERMNQKLEQYLKFYVADDQKNWARYLPLAEFAHNSWRNESTRKSPFELLMGYHPRAEWTAVTSPIPQVTLRLTQLQEARDRANEAMRKAQQNRDKRKHVVMNSGMV
jgi:Integrase zinc binding domain